MKKWIINIVLLLAVSMAVYAQTLRTTKTDIIQSNLSGGTVDVQSDFTLNTSANVSTILDEDDLVTDSASALATQQSIKAYVDTMVGGMSTLGDLTDVTLTGTAANDILSFNGTNWVNQTTAQLTGLSLGGAKDASLILDVISTTQGGRPCPAMTEAERDLIGTPATASCVYNTTSSALNVYNGASWVEVGSGGGGSGITTYTTVALSEGASCTDNDIEYVVETETFYRCEDDGAAFTRDGTFILNTSAGGNTRKLGISGQYGSGVPNIYTAVQFNTAASAPSHNEGLIYYDNTNKTLALYNDESEVTLQVGQEMWVRVTNNTGSTINNGQVVYLSGISGGIPEITLADASDVTSLVTLGMATHDIENATNGYITTFGTVRGLNTSAYSVGDILWLSDTVPGGLTTSLPDSPAYNVRVGTVTNSDIANGSIQVKIDASNNTQSVIKIFNGAILEDHTFDVSSDGVTITATLEKTGGGDLSLFFDGAFSVFDSTPTASVSLTAGTDSSPTLNYVYIPKSTMTLTSSTLGWPSEQHVPVGTVLAQSAASAQTQGLYKVHAWTDHLSGSDGQGHLSHLNFWMRQKHAEYLSGMATNFTGSGTGTVNFSVDSGVALQLHTHTTPTYASPATAYVINDSATPYNQITDLCSGITTDSAGNSLNGEDYVLVLWQVASQDDEDSRIMVNVPSCSYSGFFVSPDTARADASGCTNYTVPNQFKGTGVLLYRLVMAKNAGGTTCTIDSDPADDIRGLTPSTLIGAGSGTGGVSIHSDLSGLSADDHTQYVLADGTRNITGTQIFDVDITVTGTASANQFRFTEAGENLFFTTAGVSYPNITSATDNTIIGMPGQPNSPLTSGSQNVLIGNNVAYWLLTLTNSTCTGYQACQNVQSGSNTTAYGFSAGSAWFSSIDNSTAIGASAGGNGDNNTSLGAQAMQVATVTNSLGLGFAAGKYAVTNGSFFVDSYDRGNIGNSTENSILYGLMASGTDEAAYQQQLNVNAELKPDRLVGRKNNIFWEDTASLAGEINSFDVANITDATFTRNTNSGTALKDGYDYRLTQDSSSTAAGEYVCTEDITVPVGFRGKLLGVSHDMQLNGTDNYMYLELVDVTNSATLERVSLKNTDNGIAEAIGQTASTTATVKACWGVDTAENDTVLAIDNVEFRDVIYPKTQITRTQSSRYSSIAGYASTNTALVYYNTLQESVNSGLYTVENSSTNGFSITANKNIDEITISYTLVSDGDQLIGGLSKNSTTLTTSYTALTQAEKLNSTYVRSASNIDHGVVSWTGPMNVGDVIRPHYNTASAGIAPSDGNTILNISARRTTNDVVVSNSGDSDQIYTITHSSNLLTDRVNEIEFNLGTATISNEGEVYLVASDDSANTRTIWTAVKDGIIDVSYTVQPDAAGKNAAILKNGSVVAIGNSDASANLSSEVSYPVKVNAGDFISLGIAGGDSALGGTARNVAVTVQASFHAQPLSSAPKMFSIPSSKQNKWNAVITASAGASFAVQNPTGFNGVVVSRIGTGQYTFTYSNSNLISRPKCDPTVIHNTETLIMVDKDLTYDNTTCTIEILNGGTFARQDSDFSIEITKSAPDYFEGSYVSKTDYQPTCYIKDVKASGTAGGDFNSGSWQERVLSNTYGECWFVSLANNDFTLVEGYYDIEIKAPAHDVDNHKAKLVRDPNGSPSDEIIGSASFDRSGTNLTVNYSIVEGGVEVTSPEAFNVQHRSSATQLSDGFGFSNSFGVDEIYTQVKIIKKR